MNCIEICWKKCDMLSSYMMYRSSELWKITMFNKQILHGTMFHGWERKIPRDMYPWIDKVKGHGSLHQSQDS